MNKPTVLNSPTVLPLPWGANLGSSFCTLVTVCIISSAPSRTRMTKPRRSPSGTSMVFSKPMRSTQNVMPFSIESAIKTGVSFILTNLPVQAGRGIGKNGHRRSAGKFAEIADEMGLVEVPGLGCDAGPIPAGGLFGQTPRVPEAQHAAQMFRRQAALFQTPAAKLPRAEIGLAGHPLQVHRPMRRGDGFDGPLHAVRAVGR